MFRTKFDAERLLWSGEDVSPLYNPEISLGQVILRALQTFGPKVAQISDSSSLRMNFDEIRLKTIRAAQNLQKRGCESKEVFTLIARNSHNVAPIVFASLCLGCPINNLDPSFGKTEHMHMLKTIPPKVVFCDVEIYDLIEECLDELKIDAKVFTFGGSKDESETIENLFIATHIEHTFHPVKVDGVNETAIIICSSGTTGFSKGVCLSHAALLDTMTQLNIINSSDVMLCFSTLYWLSGLIVLITGTLNGATRIITNQTFTPELQFHLIDRYKVSFILNSPHQLVLMIKNEQFEGADLSSVKCYLTGGSRIPLYAQNELSKKLPNGTVHTSYGMSEAACIVSLDYPKRSGRDTVGQLMSGYKIKIINDQGGRCGPNTDGEICLKANYKFLGYFGNKCSTDELFDEEGFILTGDIGHFDNDGFLYIVDRKKDLMKYCSIQISPSEIEAYLIKSSGIKSACVVSIPDDVASELPAAVVVRSNPSSNLSESEVFELVADHFADHCKLRGGVYFVDSLPTTPSGKIIRRKVRESTIDLIKGYTSFDEMHKNLKFRG